jgi:hypothetical protein
VDAASAFNGRQHQLRAARHAREQAAALKAKTREVTAIMKSLAGKTFFDADSNRHFEISTTAQEIVIYDCRENQPRVAREKWSFDFLAAMNAGRIVAASAERRAIYAEKSRAVHGKIRSEIPTNATPSTPIRTAAIDQRLTEMKRLLRAACAGMSAA